MDTYTLWVCVDCMLHHANGECGSCHGERGHDREPWNLVEDHVTMGTTQDQHSCGREDDSYFGECGCEKKEFSWSSCDGCGSNLGGERYAFTAWVEDHTCTDDCYPMYACGNG